MSLFDILFIAHLFGDFIFQTNWMAVNKTDRITSLLFHAAIYTITIFVFSTLLSVGLSVWAYPLFFFSHCILDRRTLPRWWVRSVMRVDEVETKWLVIVVDQIFHLCILALSLYI